MTKHLALFLAAFVGGAIVALAVRSARHQPYALPAVAPAAQPQLPDGSGPGAVEGPAAASVQTVNTVCPICGMAVDPALEPAPYQGKLVGFGCRACPPKFARDPDRYGPAALQNRVVED